MKQSKTHLITNFQVGGYTPVQQTQTQFIPTYTGLPLAEQEKYGTQLAEVYNKNIADMTQLDILNANRKAIEGDSEVSNQITQELQSQFEEMAKKGDYENMSSRVNALARRYVNDPRRKAIEESYRNFEEEEKRAAALRDKGITPIFIGDRAAHKSISIDPETGQVTPNVYRSKMQAQLEYDPTKDKIWSVLQPDQTWSTSEARADLTTLPGYMTVEEIRGISGGYGPDGKPVGKVAQQFGNALIRYMSTPEYTQEKELLTQQLGSPEAADARIQQTLLSTGMMRAFQQKNPQFLQDWIMKKQMEDAPAEMQAALDLETGVRFELPQFSNIDKFNPSVVDTATAMRKAGDSPRYGASPNDYKSQAVPNHQRGTPEERKEFENIAKAAVNWKTPGVLDQFYNDQTQMPADAEKDFLYSPSTYDAIKEYQQHVEQKLTFNTIQSFPETTKGQAAQNAATSELQNNHSRKVFYDFETGKIISSENNPEFAKAIPDVNKLVVTGQTHGVNAYGKLTGDERFYNSQIVNYYDPKEGISKKFLVAKSVFNQDPQLAEISDLWSTGASKPFQVVNHRMRGVDIEFQDQEEGGIKVYKVKGKTLYDADGNQGITLPNYESFYRKIKEVAGN